MSLSAKTALRSRNPTNVGKKAWLAHLFPLIFLKAPSSEEMRISEAPAYSNEKLSTTEAI